MATLELGYCVEANIHREDTAIPVYLRVDSIAANNPTVICYQLREGDKRLQVMPLHSVDLIVITDPIMRILK